MTTQRDEQHAPSDPRDINYGLRYQHRFSYRSPEIIQKTINDYLLHTMWYNNYLEVLYYIRRFEVMCWCSRPTNSSEGMLTMMIIVCDDKRRRWQLSNIRHNIFVACIIRNYNLLFL